MRRTPAHRKHRTPRHGSRAGVSAAGAPPEFGDVLREAFSLAVVRSSQAGGVATVTRWRVTSPSTRWADRPSPPPASGPAPVAVDGSAYLRQVVGALHGRVEQAPQPTPSPAAVSTSVT